MGSLTHPFGPLPPGGIPFVPNADIPADVPRLTIELPPDAPLPPGASIALVPLDEIPDGVPSLTVLEPDLTQPGLAIPLLPMDGPPPKGLQGSPALGCPTPAQQLSSMAQPAQLSSASL